MYEGLWDHRFHFATECHAFGVFTFTKGVPKEVIALLFIQVAGDTNKYKEKTSHPESHHL